MLNSKVWVLLISGLLLIPALAVASDLSGRVTVRGAPVQGAVVTASLIQGQKVASTTVTKTGSKGEYALKGLAKGDYILLVDQNGKRVYQGRISLTAAALTKDIPLQ